MKIGIDIDGTVTDNFTLIKKLACEYFKKAESEISEWYWDFSKVFNTSQDEAQCFWDIHEEQIYTLPGPQPHAVEVIRKLAFSYDIVYITARTDRFSSKTVDWLKEHNIFFDKLFMSRDKQSVCLKEKINIMIDDSPEYECIAEHIPFIMFDYPYNKQINHKNIIRVRSWQEVSRVINNLIDKK